MKTIVISGGITRDATTRAAGNDKVTGFSVAVDEGWGDKKRTLYFDCSMWGGRGEKIVGMLTKGTKVSVAGELSTREHEGKTYLTIRVDQLTLMGGKPQGERQEDRQEPPRNQRSDMDDEIPF